MSVVTNVIVSGFAGCDPDGSLSVINALNAYLSPPDTLDPGQGRLIRVDQYAGGPKAIEAFVWMGAFNYLNVNEFIGVFRDACKRLRSLSFKPQLLIKQQESDKFIDVE